MTSSAATTKPPYLTHDWKLKPGWKQFYACKACGINDVDPGAHVICPNHPGAK